MTLVSRSSIPTQASCGALLGLALVACGGYDGDPDEVLGDSIAPGTEANVPSAATLDEAESEKDAALGRELLVELRPNAHQHVRIWEYDDGSVGIFEVLRAGYDASTFTSLRDASPEMSIADVYATLAGTNLAPELYDHLWAIDVAIAARAETLPELPDDGRSAESVPVANELPAGLPAEAPPVLKANCNHSSNFYAMESSIFRNTFCADGINFPNIVCQAGTASVIMGYRRAHLMEALGGNLTECNAAQFEFWEKKHAGFPTFGIAEREVTGTLDVPPRSLVTWRWHTTHDRTDMKATIFNVSGPESGVVGLAVNRR